MKKIAILSLTALLFIGSCKKENAKDCRETNKISVENASIVSKGNIVFRAEGNAAGQVAIYQLPDGKYILGLEQISFTSNRDVELYLSKTPGMSATSIKIFSFQSINGTLYHELPSHINIADFRYVIIQDDTEQDAVASAELK